MNTSSLLNPAYKDWLESKTNPYETIILLEKSEVSDVDLSDISDALEEYVRLFKAEIASPAEILTLSRAYPNEEKYSLAVIDKELDQKEPVVIGGPASVEVVDREGHIITLAAMKRAFERFMANFRTRNTMVLHSDVQVGWALPAYISKTGKIYKSGVTGDHLFFITELRDDTKIAKKVLEQIETGKMKSYSIAGSATSVEASKRDGAVVMQVNDMELAEVTICEQGVNQRAKFELMKSTTDRPTSSCVDGSCLTKSNEHIHSSTELFVNENGIIDTVGSFTNWVQKEEVMKPNKSSTDTLYAYLHKKETQYRSTFYKEEFNDPEDNPSLLPPASPPHGSSGDEGAKSREKVDAGKGERAATRFRSTKYGGEPKGNEILEMKKSHLEGCLCEECKQRTGDTNGDDTPRLATDTQGRPTLGHVGHGNVVAILVSRMQRKADKNYDMDQFGSSGERDEAVWEDKLKGQPKLESTDENFQAWRKENPGAPSHLFPSKMQKAVYEYINKSKGNPGPDKKGRAAYKEQQQNLYDRMPPAVRVRGRDLDREGAANTAYQDTLTEPRPGAHPPGKENRYFGYDTQEEGDKEYDRNFEREMKTRKRAQVQRGAEKPTEFLDMEKATKEQQDKGLGARVKLKTPHERVGESLGDGGSVRGAAGYAQDLASGEYGSKDEKAQTAIDRGGMRGAARHGARRALEETWGDKYRKHWEQGGSKAGQRATEMGREDTRPYDKKLMTKAVYEYINKAFTVPSRDELKAAGEKRKAAALKVAEERAKEKGESFTPAKPKVRPYRGPAPRRTGAERETAAQEAWREKNPGQPDPPSFTKQLLAFTKQTEMEKGVLGAVGKLVGGAAKGAAKVSGALAGGVIGGAQKLLVGDDKKGSLLGRAARFGETASESRLGQTSRRTPQSEMNMEKQEPEWVTPQTETPLHKFLDHNSKNERRS